MTIFLVFPFTRLVHVWSAPIWYLGPARLPGRALERPARGAGAPRAATSSRRSEPMSCSVKGALTQSLRKVRVGQRRDHSATTTSRARRRTIRRPRRSRPGRRPRARSPSASCCCRRRAASTSRPSPLSDDEGRTRDGRGGLDPRPGRDAKCRRPRPTRPPAGATTSKTSAASVRPISTRPRTS